MIKTISNKIVNINKNRILSSKELVLKHNKHLRLNGSNVEWWSYPENGWFFKAPSGNEPTLNTTENAVEFTRANQDYLVANKSFDYSQPFTISGWFYVNDFTNLQRIAGQKKTGETSTLLIWYQKEVTNGALKLELTYGSSAGTVRLASEETITGTGWVHFLACFDGSIVSVYNNGKFISCNSALNPSEFYDGFFNMGRQEDKPADHFNGYLDDFEIAVNCMETLVAWDGASLKYSASEQVFTPPPRTGATIPILQLQGNTLVDQKILLDGSNNILQYSDIRGKHNFVASANNPSFDLTEQSAYFDGTEFLTDLGDYTDFDFGTNDFDITFYVMVDTIGVDKYLFGTNNSTGFAVGQESGSDYITLDLEGNTYNLAIAIVVDTWYFVRWVRKSGTLKGYLEGVQGYSAANVIDVQNASALLLGKDSSGSNFAGYLDNLTIRNAALIFDTFTPIPRNFPNL